MDPDKKEDPDDVKDESEAQEEKPEETRVDPYAYPGGTIDFADSLGGMV